MTTLRICPLSQVPSVLEASGAGWCISLLALAQRLPEFGAIRPERRLHLALSDITEATPDYILAESNHLDALLSFLARWDRDTPMLIHCYAGVSRSTAVALVALCFLDPETPESDHARRLRRASPTATPNRRIIALADAALGRSGRLIAAVAEIGRGADCFEGVPFALRVPPMPAHDAALDGSPSQPA